MRKSLVLAIVLFFGGVVTASAEEPSETTSTTSTTLEPSIHICETESCEPPIPETSPIASLIESQRTTTTTAPEVVMPEEYQDDDIPVRILARTG
jgi:hypothetical protein